jgi:hypothetical protein
MPKIAVRPSISTIRCFLLYPCISSTLPFAMHSSLCHDRKWQEAGALFLALATAGLQPVSGLNHLVAIICSLFGAPKKVISGKNQWLAASFGKHPGGGAGQQRLRCFLRVGVVAY